MRDTHLINDGGGYIEVKRHLRNSVMVFGFAITTVAFDAALAVPSIAQSKLDGYAYPERVVRDTQPQPVFYAPVDVTPGAATLTITRFAPTITVPLDLTPGAASLTTTAFAPTVATPREVTPGSAALATTLYAPTVATPRNVVPGSESLITTVYAPTVETPRNVTPAVASLSLTTFAPSVDAGSPFDAALFQNVQEFRTPKRKALLFRYPLLAGGFSTNAAGNRNLEPAAASLTTTLYAPTVTVAEADIYTAAKCQNNVSERTRAKKRYDPRREYHKWSFGLLDARPIMPAIAHLQDSYRTKARFRRIPQIHEQAGWRTPNNVDVTPTVASLTITTYAPTVQTSGNQEVTPPSATLTTTRYAPTVTAPRDVIPGVASLATTLYAPNVETPRDVLPGTRALTTTRYAPTVAVTAHVNVLPSPATVTTTSFAPTVTVQQQNPNVIPSSATLTLTSYAPVVSIAAPEPTVIIVGGDDAPKKKKRKEAPREDVFKQIEATIHHLLHPEEADLADSSGSVGEETTPDRRADELERAYQKLVGLAQESHRHLQDLRAIRQEINAYLAKRQQDEIDDEEFLMMS